MNIFKRKTFTPSALVYEDELEILKNVTKLEIINFQFVDEVLDIKRYRITIYLKDKEKFVIAMSDPYTCEFDEIGAYLLDKKDSKVYLARKR